MLFLTLLVIEGMARIAYYAAYGTEYGGGSAADSPDNLTPPPLTLVNQGFAAAPATPFLKRHPIYGYIQGLPFHQLPEERRPRPRQGDTVVIALLGGSVAYGVNAYLERALGRWFAENNQPRRPVFLNWSRGGLGQPQQTMLVAGALLRGGAVDLIINLDGFNELGKNASPRGAFPFFPGQWKSQVGLTAEELLLIGQIGVLRREQARRAAAGETSILRRSALFGLAQRWRQESNAAQIIRLNHELATAKSAYRLEKHGPRRWWATEGEVQRAAARLWYRSSLMLNRLAEGAGADYYHFLQPNQYVPGSKPLSPWERANAYEPDGHIGSSMAKGYPLLTGFNQDLQRQGVNYFDLTGIFVDHSETLYLDSCCHLNDRGNELLAAEMVRRLEPALRRLTGERPAGPVSPLAAGRRPADFQVSIQEDGKGLRYVREDCEPEDTEPRFFLHIVPRAAAERPSPSREPGFDNRVFSFAEVGGRRARGQCAAQISLPDYPIAALRTGQYIPDQGDLWSTELIVPANVDQLRADYAALAAAEPAARDYFDLYLQDNQLIYWRESCAAADTAAAFFLHIIPEHRADLPPERQAAGFAHQDFAFARWGGPFDGQCLATVPLPDYPIAAIRTGQAERWAVDFYRPIDPEQLRAAYAALAARQPVARADFDLYIQDNRLIYLRESCAAADTAAGFFLHIVPEDGAALPADRQAAGFAHQDFDFARWGGHFDGKCLAAVPLPDYPIAAVRTGQEGVWDVAWHPPADPALRRADYAALSQEQPILRDAFDLYLQDNRLLYLRETCVAADTAAGFFLHIIPEDVADLPAEQQAAGFANRDFAFAQRGAHFDGKCLAAVSLPDYPIREIRTGQYVPGQGEAWSVGLVAAP